MEKDLAVLVKVENAHDEAVLDQVARDLRMGKRYDNPLRGATARVIDAMLVEANDRYYAVLFWFVVAGPMGALIYRCASFYSQYLIQKSAVEKKLIQACIFVHKILDWLPAQLAALSYSITGSFIHALANWRTTPKFDGQESVNAAILIHAGRGAALFQHENDGLALQLRAVTDLIWRTVWLWVVCLAIVTLGGWVE